jgi:uncharacterized protein
MLTVCIDTNVVVGMFGRTAPHLPLRQALLDGKINWAVSTEILLEYEEIVLREMGAHEAQKMLRFIEIVRLTRDVVSFVSPSFRFHLITFDPDDDKFADCAIAAHADYVITSDRDFRPLAGAGYKPQPITPEDFIQRHLMP